MVLVWKPITDLPEEWSHITDGELRFLLQFWNDQRTDLDESGALATFSQRLAREWAIETGQIEGVYNLDRGVTETLIERGINADLIPTQPGQKPPELIAAIIQDHANVLEGLFQFVRGERPLSKGYIHELHAALMKHQDTTVVRDQFGQLFEAQLVKGKYKQRPNNPQRADGTVYEFCPPEQVEPEMERLLAMHAEHEKCGVPVEVEAAWLHHRFTQIHPYQDGNGRVARALASLLFVKAGWFPVVVTRDDRPRYLDALEVADEGELRSLVSFSTYIQKRTLFEVIQGVTETREIQSVDEAIAAAKRALTSLGKRSDPVVWSKAKRIADLLMGAADARLEGVAASLRKEIAETGAALSFKTSSHATNFLRTGDLPYKPNRTDYAAHCRLEVEDKAASILDVLEIQAHAIGSKFRGLIGFVVCFSHKHQNTEVASKEPFLVNYAETDESAWHRFRPWLEESLVNALTLWRKSL
ncbi:MAG TPA: Fic family protein [Candidatus Angelobacter sp.]|nr:Fic family protein [Candidatus Angelobacter sp.]